MNKKVLTAAALISLSAAGLQQPMTASEVNSSISSPATPRSAEIYSRLVTLIADYREISELDIKMESRLKEDLGLESIDMLDLYSLIYFEFEVNIPTAEFMDAITVADLYDLIILNSNN